MTAVSSNDVYDWPEFKAFAARLGIPALNDRKIVITLEKGEAVVVEHDYLGKDMAKVARDGNGD